MCPLRPMRDHMRVLDKQKLIADLSAFTLFDEFLLDPGRIGDSRRGPRSRTSHLRH